MPEPVDLTTLLPLLYTDRNKRRKEIEMGYDVNISKNDLMANVFYFIILGGACLWLAFF